MAESYWRAPSRSLADRFHGARDVDVDLVAFLADIVRAVQEGKPVDEEQRAVVRFFAAYVEGAGEDPKEVRSHNRALALAVAASPPAWASESEAAMGRFLRALATRDEEASAREVPERLTEAALRLHVEAAREPKAQA